MSAARDDFRMIIASARAAASQVMEEDAVRKGVTAWAKTLRVPEGTAIHSAPWFLAACIIDLMLSAEHLTVGTRIFVSRSLESLANALSVACNIPAPAPQPVRQIPVEEVPYRPGVTD